MCQHFVIRFRDLSGFFLAVLNVAILILGLYGQSISPLSAQSIQRNLDTRTPFTPPSSLEQWERRAEQLRLQLQVALGIYPYPELPLAKSRIYGKLQFKGYSVEKCTIEVLPGFFVTGNLYRPSDLQPGELVPGILCPHGHWNHGRFLQNSEVRQELASGAERFESSAISPLQARCVQLARMGCVVLIYDMIGYADSQQISYQRAHGFANQPADQEVNDQGWLFYSPLAESNAQSIMGLQTLSTLRTVDAILSLPEIDPGRIGITGASGGGTQSFIAAALDPRIKAAFPAVMVSTGMQGGCVCENSSLLRVGTNNVEITALIAPKPLGLTAADDWTRTMPEDGFPELKQVYQMYGNPDRVSLYPALHFGHNFNHISRVSMYGFFNDYFQLGFDKPILESDFDVLTPADLSVWNHEDVSRPETGLEFERKLLKQWHQFDQQQFKHLQNGDCEAQLKFQAILTNGWRVVLGLTAENTAQQAAPLKKLEDVDGPVGPTFREYSLPDPTQVLLKDHKGQVYTYSYLPDSQALVPNRRMAAGYTYGYNLPAFARQGQELALALQQILDNHERSIEAMGERDDGNKPKLRLQIRADGAAAALATAAVFCLQEHCRQQQRELPMIQLFVHDADFRFTQAASIQDAAFLPGSAKYGDWPGLVSCLHETISFELQNPSSDFE